MKKLFVASLLILSTGCTSLNSISQKEPLFQGTTAGHHEDYAYCVVQKLRHHRSFAMTGLRYDMESSDRRGVTQVTSAAKVDNNFGVFILDVNRVDNNRSSFTLRGARKSQYEIKQTIIAMTSCVRGA